MSFQFRLSDMPVSAYESDGTRLFFLHLGGQICEELIQQFLVAMLHNHHMGQLAAEAVIVFGSQRVLVHDMR